MRTALITGISGQDGVYLAELLLQQGYRVIGVARQFGAADLTGLSGDLPRVLRDVQLVQADITDLTAITGVLQRYTPDEVYNLASQSSVGTSWQTPLPTGAITALGAATVMEAVRVNAPQAKFLQASSSEILRTTEDGRCNENTPLTARNPYAAAKLYAHCMAGSYRTGLGLHMSCAIMFNHDSPLRRPGFVTRKISDGVARIKLGLARSLELGNLDAARDWGHARDYVRAMWLILQQEQPDDYVVGTGRSVTVRHLVKTAFAHVGLEADEFVTTSGELLRPLDADSKRADASKARVQLGWEPRISLEAMIGEMVEADLAYYRRRQA